jgi:hypothetical protein
MLDARRIFSSLPGTVCLTPLLHHLFHVVTSVHGRSVLSLFLLNDSQPFLYPPLLFFEPMLCPCLLRHLNLLMGQPRLLLQAA